MPVEPKQDAPLAVGQVRRSPHTRRHFVVVHLHRGRCLVVLKTDPENFTAWDDVETIEKWSLVR